MTFVWMWFPVKERRRVVAVTCMITGISLFSRCSKTLNITTDYSKLVKIMVLFFDEKKKRLVFGRLL